MPAVVVARCYRICVAWDHLSLGAVALFTEARGAIARRMSTRLTAATAAETCSKWAVVLPYQYDRPDCCPVVASGWARAARLFCCLRPQAYHGDRRLSKHYARRTPVASTSAGSDLRRTVATGLHPRRLTTCGCGDTFAAA